MHFAKVHGLGNDFIIVDADQLAGREASQVARTVCRRSFSLGADGLIVFRQTDSDPKPLLSMQVFNADGSEAELSGNGLRCLAALWIHQGKQAGKALSIQTLAGAKTLILTESKPPHYSFKLLMGEPILDHSRMDFQPERPDASWVGYPLPVEDRICAVTVTSMGNPHCSLFVEDLKKVDWEWIGSRIEVHSSFPKRTNVEFVQVKDRKNLAVCFWERGVGRTYASGTGACAAVVAAFLNGHVDREVQVHTLGGILEVCWREDNQLSVVGPTRFVCHGEYFFGDD